MKSLFLPAAVVAVILSACGKEPAPPSKPPAEPSFQAAPAPGGTPTMEEKQKAMDDAKAAAKAGARKGE